MGEPDLQEKERIFTEATHKEFGFQRIRIMKALSDLDVKPKPEQDDQPQIKHEPVSDATLKTEPKTEQHEDKDELAALDALESEAKEFSKVKFLLSSMKSLAEPS